MKYFNLYFTFCYTLTVYLFDIRTVQAIIGGRQSLHGEFSHVIAVLANDKYICGGVIIGEHRVLTAASCVIDKNGLFYDREYSILMGVNNLIGESPNGLTMDVETIYVPNEYKRAPTTPNTDYYYEVGDIAVLKLENGLGLRSTTYVTKAHVPVRSSARNFPRYVNEQAFIAGFGVDTVDIGFNRDRDNTEIFRQYCSKLKVAETVIIDTPTCMSMFPIPIVEKHVCAKVVQHNENYPEGVCHGDIGSPLFAADKTLIGILVQNRHDCNEKTYAALYTRIIPYVPFINKATREGNSQPDANISGVRVAAYKIRNTSVGSSSGQRYLEEITH